ncbi:MAG: DUF4167 domain-containing protein [Pseudomonadota bacterium]
MRQGQQNRRGRGRNRKSQNPLTRSFESSGPDVKIRGTPSHIAEKYISMARDALSSGDPVLAENYLQHAEHYNRIIMTYREQQAPQGEVLNGGANGRHKPMENGESDAAANHDGEEAPRGQEMQPTVEMEDGSGEQPAAERPQRRSNGTRHGSRRRRSENGDARADAGDAGDAQPTQDDEGEKRPARRRAAMADADEQPDFLKRPVRRGRRPAAQAQESDTDGDSAAAASDEAAE